MTRNGGFKTEKELAEIVVRWLEDQHWEVYQEVPVGSGIADIVAKQGKVLWLIETKLSMNLQLINQLDDRVGSAHMTSAAIPIGTRRYVPHNLFRKLGVGLITVWGNYADPEQKIRPRFFRKIIGIELKEEYKTFSKAGSKSGGCWTPFKETSRNVASFVTRHPGCTMKEMLAGINHHYASLTSANVCIVNWIEQEVIKGVRIDRSEKTMKLYPTEAA